MHTYGLTQELNLQNLLLFLFLLMIRKIPDSEGKGEKLLDVKGSEY